MVESKYNLIDEKWIPVAEKGWVSLRQIFSDATITALGGNPVEKIAVFKLLLAIGQSAFTPKDEAEWKATSLEAFAKKVMLYLDAQHDNFYLYGEKPFLQVKDIVEAEKTSYGSVKIGVAAGNTVVVTEIQIERILDDAEKALLLLVLMGFAFGGKKTDNSVVLSAGYTKKSNEKGKHTTGKPGPSLLSLGVLHSFAFSKSVQDSVFLNLLSHEKLSGLPYGAGLGIAPWEKMPEGEDDSIAKNLKDSYFGRLVPLSRFILFADDGLHYSEGLAHASYADGITDPSMTVDFSAKPKIKVLWADPEKRPWRQLPALLSFLKEGRGGFECQQLKNVMTRVMDYKTFSVWVAGIKVSSNAGEQYLSGADDFVESEVQLSGPDFDEKFFNNLTLEMGTLDDFASTLSGCVRAYFKRVRNVKSNADASVKSFVNKATSLYWQLCEGPFQSLVDACGVDSSGKAAKAMRPVFWGFVRQVYDSMCANQTVRQLEAWAECRPQRKKEEVKGAGVNNGK